jgi:uncharacterized protein YkwD
MDPSAALVEETLMRPTFARQLRVLVAVAVMAATLATPALAASSPAPTDWLGTLNAYRSTAGLPAAKANRDWVAGDVAHSRYTVLNGEVGHSEDPSKPGYSEAGHEAGTSGNVMATSRASLTARDAIDMWMQGPFHAAGLLDPRLRASAYGQYVDESAPRYRAAATMDTIRGLDTSSRITAPVVWPGNGSGVPQTSYTGGEWPDPLTPCPGYTVPSGLPIVILGGGDLTASSLSAGGAALQHCAYDASDYRNPDTATRDYARRGMAARGAVFIVPRQPLVVGTTYTVSATVDGRSLRWSFEVTDGSFVPAGTARTTETTAKPAPAPKRQPEPRIVPAELSAACPDSMPDGGFADVSDDGVHRAAIDCVAWWEVSTGTRPGRYAPASAVTRAQMASFLERTIRAAGVELPEGRDRFVDDRGSAHERAINTLANAGVVGGVLPGVYRPDAPVTRGQMATMLARAVALVEGEELPEGRDRFSDDDGSAHEAAINRAANAELASGTSATTFAPGRHVARGQMATFVARALNRLSSNGYASPPSE